MSTHPLDTHDQEEHLTVADYRALDDDAQYELVRGNLLMTPAPHAKHQKVAARLAYQLQSYVYDNDLGECFPAPFDVVLSEDSVVQPDLTYVSHARLAELYDGHGLTGAPDLVVEVLSPATASRDLVDKRSLYAEARVPWLIFVDPDERVVEVFELADDGRYALDQTGANGDDVTLGLFPNLTLRLSKVWFDEPA